MLIERVLASIEGSSVVEYEVELGYDDLPLDQVNIYIHVCEREDGMAAGWTEIHPLRTLTHYSTNNPQNTNESGPPPAAARGHGGALGVRDGGAHRTPQPARRGG